MKLKVWYTEGMGETRTDEMRISMMKRDDAPQVRVNREQIRTVLQQRGWRQQQLARATGLSTPTISRLITGSRPTASIATLRTLAAVLGVPLDELIISDTGEPSQDALAPEPDIVPAPPPGPPTPQQRIAAFFAEHPELAARFAALAGREPEYIAELLEGMIRAEDVRSPQHVPPDQSTGPERAAG